ncbi:BnaA07g00070D [Brassica napus]|uniref:BnaA07g00070D protein n=1 Tax=Brassica napus TaxID=3708 RepID=A0A078H549_BRANA|nr:BnaA07g00070D [Brassica napus]
MEEALEMARAKDTKERMAAVERLHQLLEASRKSLSPSEVTSLVDSCLDLLKDSNFRVSQGALQALASAAVLAGEHLKLHLNALVPAVVERLGDSKQPVRDAARRLLTTLMEVSSPTIIVERAGSYGWLHKSWRVREEFARTVTSAIGLFASTELPLQRVILAPILQMLNDPNQAVREAAILCIEEMYMQGGNQFREELQRHHLPSYMVKDINARLERIEPQQRSTDSRSSHHAAVNEVKASSVNPKKRSPKAKISTRENSLFGGDPDITEKPIEPINVYSEKELIREFEKIASTLVPEKDWSMRISAMRRVEGLVAGGATDYSCFRGLLKQLIGPLSTQLSDRRSTIVKQACHLLCLLSKELLGDFESCAEIFIPVLFKLVVITVLVIAESADNCIKTMLRNCKAARVLPRIAEAAKHDRNAVLRARCCEYALLTLEHWPDAPEIQRSVDLYEDLIRCCVADAMSEVRATARMCYRLFAKTWPDRSRRLFSSFDPVIQRLINEEEGGSHRRHASPSVRERHSQPSFSQTSAPSNLPGLKLWLAKLTPLTRDKNTKLKEASITCIISVYNHYDSAGLLNYILSLSVEEQNSLRRSLKQYTPRIEVDLLNYMQSKKEKLRVKSYDPSDAIGTSSEEGYPGASKKNIFLGRYSGGSVDSDSGRKWSSSQEPTTVTGGGVGQSVYSGTQEKLYHNFRSGISSASDGLNQKDSDYTFTSAGHNLISRTSPNGSSDKVENFDSVSPPHLEKNGLDMTNADSLEDRHENEASRELDLSQYMLSSIKVSPTPESGPSIPQILHMINASDGSPSSSKISGLQQLIEASVANEESVWTKYFNQILTVVLEVVDDEDLSVREVALSLISEMLKSQKDAMEDSVEIVIEKLLHVSKDSIPKVSSEAEQCLTTVLSQYDPFRCLSVIVPQLVTEDEKTLVACINCLTKLVGRLSQEELMDQLSSFLPAVFEAFGNQSADVRKTVVFCLVDIYIMLGKAFLPYLEGLNSTQVRLVTIYANRISQARTGAPIDPDT